MTFTQLISACGLSLVHLDGNRHRTRVRCAANYKHSHQVEPVTFGIVRARGHELSDQFDLLVFEVGTHCRFFRSVDQIHGLGFDLARFVPWQIALAGALSPGGLLRIVRCRQRRLNGGFVTGQIVDSFDDNPDW